MDAELQALMRKGVAELRGGRREAAHQLFLELLTKQPEYVPALVYVAVSAPTREEAQKYLNSAEALAPDHPAVRRGRAWFEKGASPPPIRLVPPGAAWVSRSIQTQQKKGVSGWLVAGVTLFLVVGVLAGFLMLVLGTFYYLNVLRPGSAAPVAVLPAESLAPVAFLPSLTWTPNPSPTAAVTRTSTPKPTITYTPTTSASPTITLPPADATEKAYPLLGFLDFAAAPERYAGAQFRLRGEVVEFGEASLEGELIFALLLGPPPDDLVDSSLVLTPVLVLGISPDAAFDLEAILTVYGSGAEVLDGLTVQGVIWDGPVILGEGLFVEDPKPD